MPDQKTMWTRCLGGFSVMWVTKLLISPVKKRIFCPKTTKFGPKLAFLVILGQALPAHLVGQKFVMTSPPCPPFASSPPLVHLSSLEVDMDQSDVCYLVIFVHWNSWIFKNETSRQPARTSRQPAMIARFLSLRPASWSVRVPSKSHVWVASRSQGTNVETKIFSFGCFFGPSDQNELHHTPLLSKIWGLGDTIFCVRIPIKSITYVLATRGWPTNKTQ